MEAQSTSSHPCVIHCTPHSKVNIRLKTAKKCEMHEDIKYFLGILKLQSLTRQCTDSNASDKLGVNGNQIYIYSTIQGSTNTHGCLPAPNPFLLLKYHHELS